jgi:hypothetical protein
MKKISLYIIEENIMQRQLNDKKSQVTPYIVALAPHRIEVCRLVLCYQA